MVSVAQPVDSDMKVTHLYTGTKAFWRISKEVTFNIFDHRIASSLSNVSSCVEVIAHTVLHGPNDTHTVIEAPRLYLSSLKVFSKLKPSDLRIGGLTVVEGSHYANKLIAMYIFSRLNATQKSVGDEASLEVDLIHLGEDCVAAMISNDNRRKKMLDVYFDGVISTDTLGQLPHIEHIRDEVRVRLSRVAAPRTMSEVDLEWDRRLNLFKKEAVLCVSAYQIAFKRSAAASEALEYFLHGFIVSRTCAGDRSIARKRWIMAIRKVILQNSVSRTTQFLNSRDSDDHYADLLQRISIHHLTAASTEDEMDGRMSHDTHEGHDNHDKNDKSDNGHDKGREKGHEKDEKHVMLERRSEKHVMQEKAPLTQINTLINTINMQNVSMQDLAYCSSSSSSPLSNQPYLIVLPSFKKVRSARGASLFKQPSSSSLPDTGSVSPSLSPAPSTGPSPSHPRGPSPSHPHGSGPPSPTTTSSHPSSRPSSHTSSHPSPTIPTALPAPLSASSSTSNLFSDGSQKHHHDSDSEGIEGAEGREGNKTDMTDTTDRGERGSERRHSETRGTEIKNKLKNDAKTNSERRRSNDDRKHGSHIDPPKQDPSNPSTFRPSSGMGSGSSHSGIGSRSRPVYGVASKTLDPNSGTGSGSGMGSGSHWMEVQRASSDPNLVGKMLSLAGPHPLLIKTNSGAHMTLEPIPEASPQLSQKREEKREEGRGEGRRQNKIDGGDFVLPDIIPKHRKKKE